MAKFQKQNVQEISLVLFKFHLSLDVLFKKDTSTVRLRLEKQKVSSFSVFSLTSIRKFNVSYAISVQKFRGFIRNTRTFFARLAAFQSG